MRCISKPGTQQRKGWTNLISPIQAAANHETFDPEIQEERHVFLEKSNYDGNFLNLEFVLATKWRQTQLVILEPECQPTADICFWQSVKTVGIQSFHRTYIDWEAPFDNIRGTEYLRVSVNCEDLGRFGSSLTSIPEGINPSLWRGLKLSSQICWTIEGIVTSCPKIWLNWTVLLINLEVDIINHIYKCVCEVQQDVCKSLNLCVCVCWSNLFV